MPIGWKRSTCHLVQQLFARRTRDHAALGPCGIVPRQPAHGRTEATCHSPHGWACMHLQLAHIYTSTSDGPTPHGPPAFAFDIDGVLIRGKHVLPAARTAMQKLCPGGKWAYPVVFLTNGGGMSEAKKAEQLTHWLHVPVHENQVILSHTPMRDLVPRLGKEPVLVAGGGEVMSVAHSYGFNRIVHTESLAKAWTPTTGVPAHPHQHPHDGLSMDPATLELGTEAHPIKAVLVMTDPSDWLLDLQLIIDVLTSRGVPTRKEAPPGAAPVELYFSNADLVWANEHPRNRFGQGAFAHILMSLFKELTGLPHLDFPVKFFGKPNPEPYRLAERLLAQQAVALGLADPPSAGHTTSHAPGGGRPVSLPFSGIYAVGDNPAADVRGANAAGAPWTSILVQTGVFQGPGVNCMRDVAHISVHDVAAAVDAGLHRTRSVKFHSMR